MTILCRRLTATPRRGTLGRRARLARSKIRLGGMALAERRARARADVVGGRGPRRRTASCASRRDKRFAARTSRNPLLRGPARLLDAFALLPRIRRACPEARLPFERPAVLGAMVASALVVRPCAGRRGSARRCRSWSGGALSLAAGGAGAARLRARRLPRRRAHLDRDVRARRAARKGARALRVASRRAAAAHVCGRGRARRAGAGAAARAGPHGRRSVGALAAATEIFGWMVRHPEHPVARVAGPARPRAAAPVRDRRARRPRSSRWPRPRSPRASSSRPRRRRTTMAARHPAARVGGSRPRSSTSPSRRCGRATTPTRTSTTRAPRCSPTGATRASSCRSSRSTSACSAGWTRRSRSSSSARDDWDALTVHALYDGDRIEPWETVMTIEGDYTLFAHLETVYLGVLARRTLISTNVDARARGGQRQADHLHAGPARPPSRPDRRRLRGVRRRARSSAPDRRHHRRAGLVVGRPRARHRPARADRRVRREHGARGDEVRRVGAGRLQHRRARRLRERLGADRRSRWRARSRTGCGACGSTPRASSSTASLWNEMGDFDPRGVNERLVRKVRDALDARRLRAREDRRLGRVHRRPDPRVRAGGRAGGRLRRRLVPDPRRERLHRRHRPHRRPRRRRRSAGASARTRGSSSSPRARPSRVPLGPGRPARSIGPSSGRR